MSDCDQDGILESSSAVYSSKVEGFSERFNELLDHCGVPTKTRVAKGARRCGVTHNTFKGWCTTDKPPKTYAVLLSTVTDLLQDANLKHNPHAVTAWLMAGKSVPNPFDDGQNTLRLVEIFLEVASLAKKKGIAFDSLNVEARKIILEKARTAIMATDQPTKISDSVTFDRETENTLSSLLDMASTLKGTVKEN